MEIEDILLVTEHVHGVEKNYLTTFDAYTTEWIIPASIDKLDVANTMAELFIGRKEYGNWSSIYVKADKPADAKFCHSESELRLFLMGKTNSEEHEWYTDESKCHKDCLDLLKKIGITMEGRGAGIEYTYEKEEMIFEQGMKLSNLNGSEYVVLEKLSERNLFLMNRNSGEFVVAAGTGYYARYPKGEKQNEAVKSYGIEWSHGMYLGSSIGNVNFFSIYEKYADKPYHMGANMLVEKAQEDTYQSEQHENRGGR